MPKLNKSVENPTPWFGTSRVCIIVQQSIRRRMPVVELVKTRVKLLAELGISSVTQKEIHRAVEMRENWFNRIREKVGRLLDDKNLRAGWGEDYN